jgi:hypothetical protein
VLSERLARQIQQPRYPRCPVGLSQIPVAHIQTGVHDPHHNPRSIKVGREPVLNRARARCRQVKLRTQRRRPPNPQSRMCLQERLDVVRSKAYRCAARRKRYQPNRTRINAPSVLHMKPDASVRSRKGMLSKARSQARDQRGRNVLRPRGWASQRRAQNKG